MRPPIQPGVSAMQSSVNVDASAEVLNNPLYQGNDTSGDNPLFESSFSESTKSLVNLTGG